MKGFTVVLEGGRHLHFPNAEYWNRNGSTLELKDKRHGNKLALFNWSKVVCVHDAEDMEVRTDNNNVA